MRDHPPKRKMVFRYRSRNEIHTRTFRPSSDLWLVVHKELQRSVFGGLKGHRRHGLYEYELHCFRPDGTQLHPEDRVREGELYIVNRKYLGPVDPRALRARRETRKTDYDLMTDEEKAVVLAQDADLEWQRHMKGHMVRPPPKPTPFGINQVTGVKYSMAALGSRPEEQRVPRGVPLSMHSRFIAAQAPDKNNVSFQTSATKA